MSKRFYLCSKETGIEYRVLHIMERGEAGFAYEILSVEGRRAIIEPTDADNFTVLTSSAAFDLGRILVSADAAEAIEGADESAYVLLTRHQNRDWGIIGPEDNRQNDVAVKDGSPLFSMYRLNDGTAIYVISDAESGTGARGRTFLMLPGEC